MGQMMSTRLTTLKMMTKMMKRMKLMLRVEPRAKRNAAKKLNKWIKKGKEEKGLKKTCAKKFCKECDFCQTECKKKCSKKYDKFAKQGKWAKKFKSVCGNDICKGCSFCQEEPPTPAPTAACRDYCSTMYDKFAKQGKEGVGHAKGCGNDVCQGCSFCEEEPPTPAPTAPCRATCKKTYDKFAKKGKEGVGHAKVCEDERCQGCSFCEQDFPTPAPTGPCQEKCQNIFDKFAKKGKASEGKEAMCGKYACSGCSMCTDDEVPTEEPTAEPTLEPTAEPTAEPTEQPTAEPTPKPTEEPPPDPTPAPTTEEDYECSEINNRKDCEENECAWDKDASVCYDPNNDDKYEFEGYLGGKNAAREGLWKFDFVLPKQLDGDSGNYDAIMIRECAKVGKKPLCDHRSYCQADWKSLYVGQDHHISYFPHLNADQYWPKGWDELKNKFPKDYCTYTGAAGGQDKTLCTQGGSHAWKTASTDVSQLIACVAEPKYEPDAPFRGYLSGKNTAESGNYTFQRVRVNFDDGCGDCNYDDIMINECKKIGMNPLCDHPSYCKTDPKVVYIGQDNHIAHTPE